MEKFFKLFKKLIEHIYHLNEMINGNVIIFLKIVHHNL